jgi:hypothetical protein
MCPECVPVFLMQTTAKWPFAGTLSKPSDGLEPSTPSLPWRFPGGMGVHARSLATRIVLQTTLFECGEMRRETSRVSFLMCPFCVRHVLPNQATEHLGRGRPRRRLDDGPLPARRWNRRAALARRWSSRPRATDADPAHTHADRHRCWGLDGPPRTGSCGARRARSPAARASRACARGTCSSIRYLGVLELPPPAAAVEEPLPVQSAPPHAGA